MSRPLPGEDGFRLDPQSAEFQRDPYPTLAALREHDPVYWWTEAGAWVLTAHRDIVSVMADEKRFSTNQKAWEGYQPPPPEFADHPIVKVREANILSYEGAEHTRLRKLASTAMTRRAVRNMDPLLHQVIEEMMDRIAPLGQCDFVREIASIYPVAIVSRMLGIPAASERERRFKDLSDQMVVAFNPMASEADTLRAIHAMMLGLDETRALMDEKRANPGDDLMTDILQAESEGDRFTPDEVVTTIMSLLVAGSETTANSMAFGLLELLRHPDQLAAFRDEPALRPNAVHEILRFHMPGRFVNRFAKEDVELRDKKVRKGQLLLCSIPAAQRDPALVEDPDRFDISRPPRDSSMFGIGRHFCLGAQLARLELEVSLGRILERFPDLALAVPAEEIPYRSNPVVRGPAAIPIRYGA